MSGLGSVVEHEGKRVGVVTSAAFSPVTNAGVGLAMIRTTHMRAWHSLKRQNRRGAAFAEAIVSDLPMPVEP